MSEFTQLIMPDNQPYFSFFHANIEFLIWVSLDTGGPEVYAVNLSTPKVIPGGYGPDNIFAIGAHDQKVQDSGGVRQFIIDNCLHTFNTYLSSLGGDVDNSFPIDEAHFRQFNWVVENGLSYVGGQIAISDF